MLNQYPLWKYILIAVVLIVGGIYALPNLYGTDPALQISATRNTVVDTSTQKQVANLLDGAKIVHSPIKLDVNTGLLVRFKSVEDQLHAADLLREQMGDGYTIAQNLAADTPRWLGWFNAEPMYLGLDLRGGLYFLMEVDTDTVIKQAKERYVNDFRSTLRGKKIRALSIAPATNGLRLKFRDAATRNKANDALRSEYRELVFSDTDEGTAFYLHANFSEAGLLKIKKYALSQNITTLRKRVNELGVAEPIIQQQGDSRIVVQLPGIQDSARAKSILGATATLEFRLVDVEHTVQDAKSGGAPGSRIYTERDGRPVLLKKRVIVTGDRITNASSGFDENGRPAVMVTLDGVGARAMGNTTKENVGKPMAVVFIEQKTDIKLVKGKKVRSSHMVEEVINVATIQGVFSRRFQITGLDSNKESRDLALLLRAGALVAPIRIVEERTIGPSLGQDNINRGMRSVEIGLAFVIVFMLIYYKGFGLIANVALVMNIILMVAVLSLMQATLTLPGIAGIVLTVGMAVDANVLIFERIREELRVGNTPQASINAGYAKALSTIADSNITTFIAAVVLFILGTGPIQGFAVTLSVGIITSMFTAIMVTQWVVNLIVGGRRIKSLSI